MRLLGVAFLLLFGCNSGRSYLRASADPAPSVVDIEGEISDRNLFYPTLALKTATDPVTFRIDSPGGDVDAGMAFIEEMRAAQRRGVAITCIVDGMAASMAAVITEVCDLRLIRRQSALMFHTVSISFAPGGNQWEFERLVQAMKEWNKRLAIIAVGRMKITLAEYEANTHDKDWWLGYEEALEVGAVDGVI